VTLRPAFPGEELERKRKQILTRLLQARDEPNAVASVLVGRTLYGNEHPYGVSAFGEDAVIRSFTVEDLKKCHAASFGPNNATLIAVGDVKPDSLLRKLESTFGKWQAIRAPQPVKLDAKQVESTSIFLVDKPGAPQSVIMLGRIGAARLSEDYFSIVVMNTILGGSFTSRLNNNLR
jgi:predicted Zn-dependent peptidase